MIDSVVSSSAAARPRQQVPLLVCSGMSALPRTRCSLSYAAWTPF